MGIKWYSGKQAPSTESGSFLVLTVDDNIAEAEWRNGHWYQYRWSSQYEQHEVKAWCHLDDVKNTYDPASVIYKPREYRVKFKKDGMDNSVIYDVSLVQRTRPKFKSHGSMFGSMKFKVIYRSFPHSDQSEQLEKWLWGYREKRVKNMSFDSYGPSNDELSNDELSDLMGTARLFIIDGETGETVKTYILQDVYPTDIERLDSHKAGFAEIEFNSRYSQDFVIESV